MAGMQIDFKKNSSQMDKIIRGALAGVVIIYLYFFVWPQMVVLGDMMSRGGKLKAQLKTDEAAVADMEKYQKDIEVYKEKIDHYEQKLPAEQEIPNLLESLSSMAKKSNISIVGIAPVPVNPAKENKETKNQFYQELPILISAKSGYHELGHFINNLENADRFIKVVDIGVKSNKAMPKRHDVEMMVSTYILLKGK